jgi:hypothetical protein
VQIPKDKILEMIRSRGNHDLAGQAEQEVPDQVDTDKDKGLLDKFGVDLEKLMGGGLGDKLGM